jgi:ribosome-binding ATPase YchF (GTP1/OBG family)
MRLGIIGLPQSGKTTIFNALTRGDQPTTISGGRFEVRTAMIEVPDVRVERLSALFRPQKTTYAKVAYADIAGLEGSNNGNGKNGLSGSLLNQLSQLDGFVHVVRCFENPTVPHPAGSVDPRRDLLALDSELALSDLMMVERRLEKLTEERKKGGGRDKALIERETALFESFKDALMADIPLRDLEISPEDEKSLTGFGFLTRKPVLLVLNLSDGQEPPAIEYPHQRSALLPLQGRLEMELAQLPPDEAQLFMLEFGIQELGLQRVIRLSYDLLGVQSFFTVGEDEVRAWTVRRGGTRRGGAGGGHDPFKKGVNRAQVVSD